MYYKRDNGDGNISLRYTTSNQPIPEWKEISKGEYEKLYDELYNFPEPEPVDTIVEEEESNQEE